MKKIILSITVSSIVWASCVKETTPEKLSKHQIQQRVDSIMAEKTLQLEAAGKTDLYLRYKIEVKVKADSILNARKIPIAIGTNSNVKIPNNK